VIGAAIEVHRYLGPGHLEAMYERALAVELELRGISFERQVIERLEYKGTAIGELRIDMVVDNRLIVELKAVESITPTHVAQGLAYLAISCLELALLINFNVPVLHQGIRRLVPRFP
jgi:GxxExxY protein